MRWRIALPEDEELVHTLLEASDLAAAKRTGTTYPSRRRASTRYLVCRGLAHIGSLDATPVVTVTAGPVPSFEPVALPPPGLPDARRPWYMQRLAVRPGCQDGLTGAHAVRHAVEMGRAAGADALRAEANPDLPDVMEMLTVLGFVRYGTVDSAPLRRTYFQLDLSHDRKVAGT